MRADVIVIGGGLSGLAVAARLAGAGLEIALVEAGETLGGRAREEHVDGFRLGGGHLAHTSWPALGELAELPATRSARLTLRPFAPGVRLVTADGSLRFWLAGLAVGGGVQGGEVPGQSGMDGVVVPTEGGQQANGGGTVQQFGRGLAGQLGQLWDGVIFGNNGVAN